MTSPISKAAKEAAKSIYRSLRLRTAGQDGRVDFMAKRIQSAIDAHESEQWISVKTKFPTDGLAVLVKKEPKEEGKSLPSPRESERVVEKGYRLLKRGEILQAGDEWKGGETGWHTDDFFAGDAYTGRMPCRRRITPSNPVPQPAETASQVQPNKSMETDEAIYCEGGCGGSGTENTSI